MLAYAYRVLTKENYKKIAIEEFEYAADLLAAILASGINNQIKRGLGKEYVQTTQRLQSPRGKINISQSVKQQSQIQKKLICNIDVFTENSYMNQILKTTAMSLLKTLEVSKGNKRELKKIMYYFSNVDQIDPLRIRWSTLKYHRNNETYKMLMNICYLVIEGLLLKEKEGSYSLANFIDDQQIHRLFEKFVLEYYRKHYPQYHAGAPHIDWNIDEGAIEFLPVMKTDITLTSKEQTLIIDTKYYSNTMQKNFGAKSFHSHNLYQIFTYVKNKDYAAEGNVSGILLYAKTDEDITPDKEFSIDGNIIGVKTLDMNTDFIYIKKQLDILAERFLE